MKLSSYYDKVRELRKSAPNLREGQAHMNVLCEYRNDVYMKIIGTDDDPFYDNKRMPRFRSRLTQLWVPPSYSEFTNETDDDQPITINLDLSWPFL